jgi:hypothetical protein
VAIGATLFYATIMGVRKPIKKYALHKRYLGISGKDARVVVIWRRRIRGLFLRYILSDGADREIFAGILIASIEFQRSIARERIIPRAPINSRRRTIDSFADIDIPNIICFRSIIQLWRLYQALKIPDKIVMPSRNICSGQ